MIQLSRIVENENLNVTMMTMTQVGNLQWRQVENLDVTTMMTMIFLDTS